MRLFGFKVFFKSAKLISGITFIKGVSYGYTDLTAFMVSINLYSSAYVRIFLFEFSLQCLGICFTKFHMTTGYGISGIADWFL